MLKELLETKNLRAIILSVLSEANVLGDFKPSNDLVENLKMIYELEYKYSMLKDRTFKGLEKRHKNILKAAENDLKGLIGKASDQILPTFERWLDVHAINNPSKWAQARYDKSYWDGEVISLVVYEAEIYGKEISADNIDLTEHKELAGLLEGMVEEAKDLWDDEHSDEENPYEDMTLDNYLYKLFYTYGKDEGFLNYIFNTTADFERIIIDIYKYIVFPVWYAYWKSEGIGKTRKRIEKARNTLKTMTSNIRNVGKAFANLNHIINIAHQTGSMLDHIQEEYPDVDEKFLKYLSNSDTSEWDDNLRSVGVVV